VAYNKYLIPSGSQVCAEATHQQMLANNHFKGIVFKGISLFLWIFELKNGL
jgi:hypothetical protein